MGEEETMDTTEKLIESFGEDPQNTDKLLPELQDYVDEDDGELGWTMLRSPFVYQVPFHSWKMANESYAAKGAAFEEAMESGEYGYAIWLLERPFRMPRLIEWHRQEVVPHDEIAKLLADVWKDTEFPHQFNEGYILALFRGAGFVSDAERNRPDLMQRIHRGGKNEITVYRGVGRHGEASGMSWTLKRETAEFFARRFGKNKGSVFTATIPTWGILAYLTGRDEEEIVVDPADLTVTGEEEV